MEYLLYADESGTSPPDKCFTIGCLLVPSLYLDEFESRVLDLIKKHNLPTDRELKWQRVKKSHGVINFLIDITQLLLTSPVSYICKVSWKKHYKNWNINEERAFYKSYTMLMSYCATTLHASITAKIDDKSDSYKNHVEVVKTIANYNLKNKLGDVKDVEKCDSKSVLLIQIADLFTGAINASHSLYLNPAMEIHNGKKIAISKISECLGWDALHYDTYPNSNINIWHFPEKEYRAIPESLEIIPNSKVNYVLKEELV